MGRSKRKARPVSRAAPKLRVKNKQSYDTSLFTFSSSRKKQLGEWIFFKKRKIVIKYLKELWYQIKNFKEDYGKAERHSWTVSHFASFSFYFQFCTINFFWNWKLRLNFDFDITRSTVYLIINYDKFYIDTMFFVTHVLSNFSLFPCLGVVHKLRWPIFELF